MDDTAKLNSDSRQILKDIVGLFGIDINNVDIVTATLDEGAYHVCLTLKTVGYIKRGSSTIIRGQKSVVADIVRNGIAMAICNARDDPRPTPRRFR